MKDLNKYGFNGVSIHFTATCNLKCKYCFQPKLNSMSENNKKIIDKKIIRVIIRIEKRMRVEICIVAIRSNTRWKIIMYIQHI